MATTDPAMTVYLTAKFDELHEALTERVEEAKRDLCCRHSDGMGTCSADCAEAQARHSALSDALDIFHEVMQR